MSKMQTFSFPQYYMLEKHLPAWSDDGSYFDNHGPQFISVDFEDLDIHREDHDVSIQR